MLYEENIACQMFYTRHRRGAEAELNKITIIVN